MFTAWNGASSPHARGARTSGVWGGNWASRRIAASLSWYTPVLWLISLLCMYIYVLMTFSALIYAAFSPRWRHTPLVETLIRQAPLPGSSSIYCSYLHRNTCILSSQALRRSEVPWRNGGISRKVSPILTWILFFHMIMSLMCVAFTLYNAVVRIYMFANHYLDVGCEIRIVWHDPHFRQNSSISTSTPSSAAALAEVENWWISF